jgi:hypothetical protein
MENLARLKRMVWKIVGLFDGHVVKVVAGLLVVCSSLGCSARRCRTFASAATMIFSACWNWFEQRQAVRTTVEIR